MNMQPFLYVHQLYSNMIDKVSEQVSVRWSFYMQSDGGKLVVLRAEQPHLTFAGFGEDEDGESGEGGQGFVCINSLIDLSDDCFQLFLPMTFRG